MRMSLVASLSLFLILITQKQSFLSTISLQILQMSALLPVHLHLIRSMTPKVIRFMLDSSFWSSYRVLTLTSLFSIRLINTRTQDLRESLKYSDSLLMTISLSFRNSYPLTPSRLMLIKSIIRFPMLLYSYFWIGFTYSQNIRLRLLTNSQSRLLSILIGSAPGLMFLNPNLLPYIFSQGFRKQDNSSSHHLTRILSSQGLLSSRPGTSSSQAEYRDVPSAIFLPMINSTQLSTLTSISVFTKMAFITFLKAGNSLLVSTISLFSRILISLVKSVCLWSKPISSEAFLSMSCLMMSTFLTCLIFSESSESMTFLLLGGYLVIRNCRVLLEAQLQPWQNLFLLETTIWGLPYTPFNCSHLQDRLRSSFRMSPQNLIFISQQLIFPVEYWSKQQQAVQLQKLPTHSLILAFYSVSVVVLKSATAISYTELFELVDYAFVNIIRDRVGFSTRVFFLVMMDLDMGIMILWSREGNGGRMLPAFSRLSVGISLFRPIMLCFRDTSPPLSLKKPWSLGDITGLQSQGCFELVSLLIPSDMRSLMLISLSNLDIRLSVTLDWNYSILQFCFSRASSSLVRMVSNDFM